MGLPLTDGDEDPFACGGASFSLQRRLQPASGPFFRGAVSARVLLTHRRKARRGIPC
jgi:hypothetical protein